MAPTGASARRACDPSWPRTGADVEFLALALALIVVGVTIVLLRHRRPGGINAGIDDFAARRQALDPDGPPRTRGRRAG